LAELELGHTLLRGRTQVQSLFLQLNPTKKQKNTHEKLGFSQHLELTLGAESWCEWLLETRVLHDKKG